MAIKIVQGEDRTLKIRLKDENGDAYDLTGQTEISAELQNSSGGCVTKTVTGGDVAVDGSDDCGVILVTLDEVDTAALIVGKGNMEIVIDKGTDRRIVQLKNSFEGVERIC